ncbi:hypothetical protein KC19_9G124500 [Ceratodon purpureus]|uniref:Uncharacterized protein n=1 Tax=Ceratodon purpureus TaxID=3225 RepID=A0A8T0GRA5_CERPU|nr:hypothetical protein KC19_9G124500 [Ceratodon purpureus]
MSKLFSGKLNLADSIRNFVIFDTRRVSVPYHGEPLGLLGLFPTDSESVGHIGHFQELHPPVYVCHGSEQLLERLFNPRSLSRTNTGFLYWSRFQLSLATSTFL